MPTFESKGQNHAYKVRAWRVVTVYVQRDAHFTKCSCHRPHKYVPNTIPAVGQLFPACSACAEPPVSGPQRWPPPDPNDESPPIRPM